MPRTSFRLAALAASILPLAATAALADTVTLQSPNEQVGGFFGVSVSYVPDLTGDGVSDVIVGASDETVSGVSGAGRVYIFNGATGALVRSHSGSPLVSGGSFGTSVAGLHDVNGDGLGDYVVGADGESGNAGKIYVFSGSNGFLLWSKTSINPESGGKFGRSVAEVADVDNDGRPDVLVGAPGEDGDRGHVYLFSGGSGLFLRQHNSPNAEISGSFGESVSGVPDLNNDGRGDYVIGAAFEGPGASPSGAGRAYVFSGISGFLVFTLKSPLDQSIGRFGEAVAGVPDVNGDGKGDILVGAPYEDFTVDSTFHPDAGRAYLFNGSNGLLLTTYQSPAADLADFGYFGASVAGTADRNGDGKGDCVVGATGTYNVYVFKGTGDFAMLNNFPTPDGTGINQFYGYSVAGNGDANADGRGDVLIGGPGSDDFPSGPSQAGRAWMQRSPLTNDSCTIFSTLDLLDGPNAVTNIGANGTAIDTDTCTNRIGSDVWYTYVASCDGSVTFSTCADVNFDSVIAVYSGCGFFGAPLFGCSLAASSPIACNDDGSGCPGFTSSVTVDCSANQCFFVRLGGYLGAEGHGVLTVSCSCPGDLNGDHVVNGADLGILIGNWNGTGPADLNGDGIVNGADLGILIGNWGPC